MPDYQAAAAELYQQGMTLCSQWEQLGEQQFTALEQGDLSSLAVIQTGQLRLADQLYRLQQNWQRAYSESAASPRNELQLGLPSLRQMRSEFLGMVQRVFAINSRNVKALAILIMLGNNAEPATAASANVYDSRGSVVPSRRLRPTSIDREG
jgi:hypothetical protein